MNNLVSVVIVCMNNVENLIPCLNSVIKNTTVSHEIFVTAYKFTEGNLEKVRQLFPKVNFVESNECRGFAENNNLSLRKVSGKYCFVLNDDTYFEEPVIDKLVETMEHLPNDCAVVSPNIKNADGTVQCCGLPPSTWIDFIGSLFKISFHKKDYSKYYNQQGIFKSYNLMGAAFLIKTDIFKEAGFFDEYYFFSPEDWALSTYLNEKGYSVYVNSDVSLIHLGGGSFNFTKTSLATYPAFYKGNLHFYSGKSITKKILLASLIEISCILRVIYWRIKTKEEGDRADLISKALVNTIVSICGNKTPKQIFIKFFK